MGLFRRNKKKVEIEDQELDTKDALKDKPKRTRKKKEPEKPKPWGKNERYMVLIVLLSTVVASGLLALSARSWKLPNLPRVQLPQDAFSETYVVERAAPSSKSEVAIRAFEQATRGLSGVYGFYVYDLVSGTSYGLHQEETFQAASLIKLPVMAALYMEAEAGRISLSSEYSLEEDDKIGGAGSIQYAPAGSVYTFDQLGMHMGKESDNTAFGVVRTRIGDKKINSVIDTFGMPDTSLSDNITTPSDIGRFFKKLWEARIISRESRNKILSHLTDTWYESHLAAGIPEDVAVAHKYGREVHVVNDAGIVLSDDPFVLVIMSKGVVEREADEVFPLLSTLLYEYHLGLRD